MSDISESLAHASILLHQGALAELTDVEEAMELYIAAVGYLAVVLPFLPSEYADVTQKKMDETRFKVENLRRLRWLKEQPKFFPEFPMQFVRVPIPVEDFAIPNSSFFRVFWLMRIFSQSIQKGAFLTPKLYVAKEVWYQEGNARCIRHIGAKQRFFSALSRAIFPLTAMHSLDDIGSIISSLQQFIALAETQLKAFEEEMGTNTSLKAKKKGFWASLQSSIIPSEKEVKYEQLLATCITFFDQCQIFERLHIYFSEAIQNKLLATSEALELLEKISKLLYAGPCLCILRDILILADRYHHKSRKSVCALLPVELKIVGDD